MTPVATWLPALIAGLVLLPSARIAWRAGADGGRRLAMLASAVAAWCLGTAAAGVGSGSEAAASVGLAVLAAVLAGPAWFSFTLRYTGVRTRLRDEVVILLPALAVLLAAWGGWADAASVRVHAAAMLALGAAVLLIGWSRALEWQRWRYPVLLAAAASPLAAERFLAAPGGGFPFGPVPVASALAVLVLVVTVAGRRSFESLPLAHRLVFDSLPDAQLVVDRFGRLLDLNPAAERLLDLPLRRARGKTLSSLAPHLASTVEQHGPSEAQVEDRRRVLSVASRELPRSGERLVSVRDVTAQVRNREVLQRRGLLLESVDALVATAPGGHADAALAEALRKVAHALDLSGAMLIVDAGTGTSFAVRASWHEQGPAAPRLGGAYAADGLVPVRDAIRRGHTTLVAAPGSDGVRTALPLRVGGHAWGALVLEGGDPEVLRDVGDALAGVARSLSSWLERERAEGERQRGERFRSGLLELTRELLGGEVGSDPHRRALLSAVEAVGGADAGSLFVRRAGGRFVCTAAFGERAAPRVGDVLDGLGEPPGRAAGRGTQVRSLAGAEAAAAEGSGARAGLVADVRVGGRTEAILRLDHTTREDAFGAREAATLQAFAAQVGTVLQRLDLQQRSEAAAEAQRLVVDIERRLLTSGRVEAFVPALARRVFASGLLPLRAVALLRPRGQRVDVELHGPDGREHELERRLEDAAARPAPEASGASAAEGAWLAELVTADAPQERTAREHGAGWRRAGLEASALLAFPLRHDGRPWGAIVWFASEEGALAAARPFLAQLAAGLQLALARQGERDQREQQFTRMQALVRTGEALRAAETRGEVIEGTLAAVLRTSRADACCLLLLDREHDRLRRVGALNRPGDGAALDVLDAAVDEGSAWRPLREGRTVVLPADDRSGDGAAGRGTAFLGTPVRNAEGDVVGVLVATMNRAGDRFLPGDTGFIEAVAQACGSTLVRLALVDRGRRQAEEYRAAWQEARRGETRFRLLAENISDTVCLHDARGRYLYLSPSVEGLLGHRPESLLGRAPHELVAPEDRGILREQLALPLSMGVPVHGASFRMRHRDGRQVWVETHVQPVHDEEGRIVNLVSTTRDVTERKQLETRLVHGALYDDLTGLPNRALLMDRLQHALERSRRQGRRFAVLFLDLDRFKLVNDSLGHHAGDQLLAAIAARLAGCVRGSDTVARLGGDEFCVLLEEVDDDEVVLRSAERIQAALTQRFPLGDTDLFTSASIGIAFSHPDYQDPGELLRDADVAMYRAKAAGKARHEVFRRGMQTQAVDRLALETALHRAIERGELRLAFQPFVEVATGRVAGVEALVRWAHPERGLLQPSAFVPLAEESGLVIQLDRWVLARACRQLLAWQEEFEEARTWTVSVNLSPMHFALDDPAGTLLAVVEESGLDPARVKIEVTEHALQGRSEGIVDVLTALRSRGVAVGIDDFGTGYSSLASLKHLPIDSLKVDMAFVRGMAHDLQQRELVGTIVSLARGLGIHAVAEGVEEPDQLDALRTMGCRYAQGWLWSKPAEAAAFVDRYLTASAGEA